MELIPALIPLSVRNALAKKSTGSCSSSWQIGMKKSVLLLEGNMGDCKEGSHEIIVPLHEMMESPKSNYFVIVQIQGIWK